MIVYQEQIMRILHDLGGLTLADALSCIKSISKKRSEEVDARAEAFLKGAQKKHMTAQVAEELFALIRHFAEYGFNKAHATAYAYLAYRTAYLKANYPMEFAAADLSCEMGDSERLKEHVSDCIEMKLTVLPPCVNEGGGLLHRLRREGDPIRHGRRQERRRADGGGDRARARGRRAVHVAPEFLRPRGLGGDQPPGG